MIAKKGKFGIRATLRLEAETTEEEDLLTEIFGGPPATCRHLSVVGGGSRDTRVITEIRLLPEGGSDD